MLGESQISRAALGRIANLGDLYDAQKDTFVGVNIFNHTISQTSIKRTDNPSTNIDFEKTDCLTEKCNKLNVNAELRLSVIAGLLDLKGSGNYLREEKKSAKTERMTLIYSVSTVSESINILSEELVKNINSKLFNSSFRGTHIVVGIDWGANSTITAESTNQENVSQTEIKAQLSGVFKDLTKEINGNVSGQSNYKEQESANNFSFHCISDMETTDDLPITFREALTFVKKVPLLIKDSNNGKGKPLSYILLPISSVRHYLQHLQPRIAETSKFKELDAGVILKVQHLFEDISLVSQDFYDLDSDVQSQLEIRELNQDFDVATAKFKSELKEILVDVRSDKTSDTKLENLIQEFKKNHLSTIRVHLNYLKQRDTQPFIVHNPQKSFRPQISQLNREFMDIEDKIRRSYSGQGIQVQTERYEQ